MKKIWVLSIVMLITVTIGFACGGDAAAPTKPPTATSPAMVDPTATSPAPTATSPAMLDPTATTATSSGGGDAELGKQLAQDNICVTCHSTDGSAVVGPTWKGLYGSTRPLEGGSTVTADEAYLEESIKNPAAKVAQGFPPIMPTLPITDAEIQDIIAYIKSLQ